MPNYSFIPPGAGNTNGGELTTVPRRFIPLARGTHADGYKAITGYWFYPRWRGENTRAITGLRLIFTGLSRWRGEHLQRPASAIRSWFYPAGAGNTCSKTGACHGSDRFIRWRGEHSWYSFDLVLNNSSLSPLAQGTLLVDKTKCGNLVYPLARGTLSRVSGDVYG